MNRIQTACICLIASTFVLTGILVLRLDQVGPANTADADQVIAQPQFSLMTARTRGADESLFVLNSNTGKLVVYHPNVGREQLEVVRAIDLGQLFNGRQGNDGRGRNRGR
ncbi:MAG: hypothetical protein AAGA29_12370 [Planctomycetota bacterium]